MRICDVCNRESFVSIHSCFLTAMSFAYCEQCDDYFAEPLWVWIGTIDMCGGPDEVHDNVKYSAMSFHDGSYISWSKIVTIYEASIDEIRAEEEEFFKNAL